MGAELPQVPRNLTGHAVDVHAVQLPVVVVENNAPAHAKDLAGGLKFLSAKSRQFRIAGSCAAVPGGLARRQAEDGGFYSAVGIKAESAAKVSGLIIRMSSDAHHAEHVGNCKTSANVSARNETGIVESVKELCLIYVINEPGIGQQKQR